VGNFAQVGARVYGWWLERAIFLHHVQFIYSTQLLTIFEYLNIVFKWKELSL
jgi:hypothetical protein